MAEREEEDCEKGLLETDSLIYEEVGTASIAQNTDRWRILSMPSSCIRATQRAWKRWTEREATQPEADVSPVPSAQPSRERAQTAYLDGLRGIASLLVVFMHYHWWTQAGTKKDAWHHIVNGWGWKGQHHVTSLPIIKLIFHGGTFAVSLFYIMSGYVLSLGLLKRIHSRNLNTLASSLGSAVFRRWFRLFLPIIIIDFIWMTSWHVFPYHPLNRFTPIPAKTYLAELARFWQVMKNLTYIFSNVRYWGPKGGETTYNMPTWTIPDEFKGSMTIYAAAVAFCTFSDNARLLAEVLLCAYLIIIEATFMADFVVGMIICDLHGLLRADRAPRFLHVASKSLSRFSWVWHIPLFIGLYLAGKIEHLPDIVWTRLHGIGALLVVLAVPNLSWTRWGLESRICQWLGRVSFSLYLCHEPMLWGLGGYVYAIFGRVQGNPAKYGGWANMWPLPDKGPLGLEVNVVIPGIITVGMALFVAHIATRLVDEPCVKFARWLFDKAAGSNK